MADTEHEIPTARVRHELGDVAIDLLPTFTRGETFGDRRVTYEGAYLTTAEARHLASLLLNAAEAVEADTAARRRASGVDREVCRP